MCTTAQVEVQKNYVYPVGVETNLIAHLDITPDGSDMTGLTRMHPGNLLPGMKTDSAACRLRKCMSYVQVDIYAGNCTQVLCSMS